MTRDATTLDEHFAAWQDYTVSPWARLRYSVVRRTLALTAASLGENLSVLDVGGGDGLDALPLAEAGRRCEMSRALELLRHLVVYEIGIYGSLLRWIFRRPDVPAGAVPIGYSRDLTPVMCLWIFASAAELPAFHFLLPWHVVQMINLVVGSWGLIWMVGLLGSLRTHPHLLTDEVLRVRNAHLTEVVVPWSGIAGIKAEQRDLDSSIRTFQPIETEAGTDLQIAVSGVVNVTARLRQPLVITTNKGQLEIVALSFLVDEPREFVAMVRVRHFQTV